MKRDKDQSNESSGAEGVDRHGIRKIRKEAAKRTKRMVQTRYDDVLDARPVNSRPADQILRHAVRSYDDGPIARRDLKTTIARLEITIRRVLPDVLVVRAPRSVSLKPERVGLMVFETRTITVGSDRIITPENHAIVLADNDGRWRFGLGERDPAVDVVAQIFRVRVPSEERRGDALAQLEAIVSSTAWASVAAKTLESQQRRAERK